MFPSPSVKGKSAYLLNYFSQSLFSYMEFTVFNLQIYFW
jgi:hypothetical protein